MYILVKLQYFVLLKILMRSYPKWSTAVQRHYTKKSKQMFPESELRSISPNSYIHFLWTIYILPRSVCLFCCRKIGGPIVEYINRSQTHESGNWDWGRAVPFLGIHKSEFLCRVITIARHNPSQSVFCADLHSFVYGGFAKFCFWPCRKNYLELFSTFLQHYNVR